MITLTDHTVFLTPQGDEVLHPALPEAEARRNTISWKILDMHNHSGNMEHLQLKFDALVSPDNNYVSILQTARASGLKEFPVPYVLTNCHNSLCSVGGTINEDDHLFGQDNARRYGGIFVPAYQAVLHQYMRETMAGGGTMILGSDSHTRYGALGTMGIGEGGGEVVKQLLGRTYDLSRPPVLAVVLTGSPRPGVGPHDVALALIAATFSSSFAKNKILEIIGPGIAELSMDFRMGVDVMTTESAALSSIWVTDERTRAYLALHGREQDYQKLEPTGVSCYDGKIALDLSALEPMMALPFHPSNAVPIRVFQNDPLPYLQEVEDAGNRIKGSSSCPFSILDKLRGGELYVDQALVSGCSGGLFENIAAMADILQGMAIGGGQPSLGINPASQPVWLDLMRKGIVEKLILAGATLRPAMCGSCFGVSDVPANNQLSIRHVTRNYPNREGSKPGQAQMAGTILMDARSIAATMRRNGRLTAATDLPVSFTGYSYAFDLKIYERQVLNCQRQAQADVAVRMGPNIAPWPKIPTYTRHLLLRVAGSYKGPVTTDELVPSGDATAYRSNPQKLADYTMINRDAGYREQAKSIRALSQSLRAGIPTDDAEAAEWLKRLTARLHCNLSEFSIGSLLVADQIGDGSSREQAASCQKVLGGCANLANEYATKRYRSNCINWGILPLQTDAPLNLCAGEWFLLPNVLDEIENAGRIFSAERLTSGEHIYVTLGRLTQEEKEILSSGCLINHYQH
ncbi:MAG: hydratase [Lawsonibacter sp.]